MKRLPNLDPLRFVLASIVVLFHIPQLSENQGLPYLEGIPLFQKGTEAVYVFFVLSGFLIIRLIYFRRQVGQFSIRKFYIRRILRIFPLYYLIFLFGIFFYHALLPFLGINFEIKYSIEQALFFNVFFLANVFEKIYDPGGILAVLWSIGIEEQFYILIAPILFIIPVNRILKGLGLIFFGYFILFHSELIPFLKTYRFVYFFLIAGGMVAILEEEERLKFLYSNKMIPVFIVVLNVFYFTTNWFVLENRFLYNLLSTLLFCLLIHTLAYNNIGKQIKNSILNYLGRISYGIYMYHIIALNFSVFLILKVNENKNLNENLTIVLIYIMTFVLTIIMAHLSYKYFELKFLKIKNKFR